MNDISVVILTLNEEANVVHAVEAAKLLTDDVMVVDSGSTDRTVELARRSGARVMVRPFDDYADQRNAPHELLERRWVLSMDADECVTPEFAAALEKLLAENPDVDGVRICRKLHFHGTWVRAASNYPHYVERVLRRGKVRFVKSPGGHAEVFEGAEKLLDLPVPLHDEDRKPIGAWIERHNRYAAREAEATLKLLAGEAGDQPFWRRLRARLRLLPGWPLAALFIYWIVRGGIFEGRAGRRYCVMKSMFEYFIQLHVHDLRWRAAQRSDS